MKPSFIVVEGAITSDDAEKSKKLTQDLKTKAYAGLQPRSTPIEIEVKLTLGTPYIPIKGVVDINTNEEVDIEHKAGQVFLIDFWATWCPPCQAPMAHNQEMLDHHGERWGDKVRIIGLSIDRDVESVVKHVEAKGWKKVQHYHRAGSSASVDYGV